MMLNKCIIQLFSIHVTTRSQIGWETKKGKIAFLRPAYKKTFPTKNLLKINWIAQANNKDILNIR